MPSSTVLHGLVGVAVGVAGSLVAHAIAPGAAAINPLLGATYGALFAYALAERAETPGAGLLWGIAFSFIAWLGIPAGILPLMHGAVMGERDAVRGAFPALVAYVLCYGLPLGLTFGFIGARRSQAPFSFVRALVSGALAGVLGGWAFGKWMEQVNFFPLVAGIVNSSSRAVGVSLHFAIAIIIGASFGLLFQREIRGLGSSLGWGVAYGLLWWFIGPLAILPLLTHRALDWSYGNGAALFGSLVGHIVYGLILGVIYAWVDRIWRRLFYESDPLNREAEGPGLRTILTAQWGLAGGLAGSLAAAFLAFASGVFAHGAPPAMSPSGSLFHLAIGGVVGAAYGVLFSYEAPDIGAALAWGVLYGVIAWFVGTLTLAPLADGRAFSWTLPAAGAAFPALIGDVVFGAVTAAVFLTFERHHKTWLAIDPRLAALEARRHRPVGTSAPAVWVFFIGLSVTLPLLLR